MSEMSRVTLVLPKKLWDDIKRIVPARQRSRLVAEALSAEIRRRKRLQEFDDLRQFHAYMQQKYGQATSSAEDIEQMRTQRDAETASMS